MSTKEPKCIDEKKKTVGEYSAELLNNPEKMEIGDAAQGASKTYMRELINCAEKGIKENIYDGDFYIVVQRKRERHLVNVLRNMFYHRQTKPSPMWDMDCWRVTQKGDLFYCWTLPDRQTGEAMMEDPKHFQEDSPELLQWVYMFVNDML